MTTTEFPVNEGPPVPGGIRPSKDSGHTDLFDGSTYEVPFPQTDGHDIDELQLRLGGTLKLNRNDPQHVDLIDRMKLGQTVRLVVYANVTSKGQGFKTDGEGGETVTHTVGLTLDLIEPEA